MAPATTEDPKKSPMVPPLAATGDSRLAVQVNAAQWWLCAHMERHLQTFEKDTSLRGEGGEKEKRKRVPRVMAPVTTEGPKKSPMVPPLAATGDSRLAVQVNAAQWWLCARLERNLPAFEKDTSLRGGEEKVDGKGSVPRATSTDP